MININYIIVFLLAYIGTSIITVDVNKGILFNEGVGETLGYQGSKALLYGCHFVFGCVGLVPFLKQGNLIEAFIIAITMAVLASVTAVDFVYLEIRDRYCFTMLVLGLANVIIHRDPWLLLGGLVAFLFFFCVGLLANGAIGGGDIKLVTGMGMFFTWKEIFMSFIVYSFVGAAILAVILLLFKAKRKTDTIPFGPFLIIGFSIHIVRMFI